MKKLTEKDEKKIIELENKWVRHKKQRNKFHCSMHKDYLNPIQRENILEKLFSIIFDD
jgi:hypothetical protein